MCTREIEIADREIKVFGKKVSTDKKSAERFLKSIGVLTSKGEVSKHYKKLCIPHAQD
jgi:hypothetical protein